MSSEKYYVVYFINNDMCHTNQGGLSWREANELMIKLSAKDTRHEYVIIHEAYLSEKENIMPPSYYRAKDETRDSDDQSAEQDQDVPM